MVDGSGKVISKKETVKENFFVFAPTYSEDVEELSTVGEVEKHIISILREDPDTDLDNILVVKGTKGVIVNKGFELKF